MAFLQTPVESSINSDASFLERKLKSLRFRRNRSEDIVDTIGSLGLNLLHEPSDSLIDFIFVHGLRGGSTKTWSLTSSPAHFWPKEWLPADPDFRHVRIHSFGYNSDWADRRENLLNIPDFAQILMEEIQNSPSIRRSKITKIVFIGHSMGGLVIKKACILSRENPSYHDLGSRIHSLYFLATPHRGSDMAQTLNRMLKVLPTGSKAFLGSLERGSEMINSLNDQFRHVCNGIAIHSFVESVPMSWGIGSGLVVDKQSATLGYPDESVQAMNADHRGICKFDTPKDSNFRSLRNRLNSTVEEIELLEPKSRHLVYRQEMNELSKYLNVSQEPVNDLTSLEDDRVPGSCEWLTSGTVFLDWQFSDTSTRFFWLTAPPGNGKSITTAHVVGSLAKDTCNYFFFKHGDKDKSSLSGLLLSIAWQMGQKNQSVRKILLDMAKDDAFLDRSEYRGIWRKVFIGGVFRADLTTTQYWVIDALDECEETDKRAIDNFFSILTKIDDTIPLKVFISSRSSVELERLFLTLPHIHTQISTEDSTKDIGIYVETHAKDLPAEDNESRKELIQTIVRKSGGCFLWTVLVMRQLQDAYTYNEIEDIIAEVPEEMDELYTQNLHLMESRPRTKKLAQAVLVWTLCALRPLTVEELQNAILLDLRLTVARDLRRTVSTLCSQFVFVDIHSRVQIMHETARTFLLNARLESEFCVNLPKGNLQLALACFEHLNGNEMAQDRFVSLSNRPPEVKQSPLANYISSYFSEHLVRATSSSDALFLSITKFLQTNVLFWIEQMAESDNLDYLLDTSKHLNSYQFQRTKYASPLQDDIKSWSTDIYRIVTDFGSNLLEVPGAIHNLIPSLCPRGSAIYRQFASQETGILGTVQLHGLSNFDWEDKISCWQYESPSRCIASHSKWFAIGLLDGSIDIRWASTCQQGITLKHSESVGLLRFGNSGNYLVSASRQGLILWDMSTGSSLWQRNISSDPLAVEFDKNDQHLTLVTRSKLLCKWSTVDGSVISQTYWHQTMSYEHLRIVHMAPSIAVLSPSGKLLVIAYRNMPLYLLDVETIQPLGIFTNLLGHRGESPDIVLSVCFNPMACLNMIAVAYQDGDVTIFDTASFVLKNRAKLHSHYLCASPDGRTLASGDSFGNLKIFDFGTLQLLYQVTLSDSGITQLAFTADNLRLIDLRYLQANVWEPSALVRKPDYSGERSSDFPSEAAGSRVEVAVNSPIARRGHITALRTAYGGSKAICGKDDGSVDIYDLDGRPNSETSFQELYKYNKPSSSILDLDYNEAHQIIASADATGSFKSVRICKNGDSNTIIVVSTLLESRLPYPHGVKQLLISYDGRKLLVSSFGYDSMWSLETGTLLASQTTAPKQHWKWFLQPEYPDEVFILEPTVLRSVSWDSSEEFTSVSEYAVDNLQYDSPNLYENMVFDEVNREVILKFYSQQSNTAIESRIQKGRDTTLHTMPTFASQSSPLPLTSTCVLRKPSNDQTKAEEFKTAFILGIIPSTAHTASRQLVFLDDNGWICTLDLESATQLTSFKRHFFIPSSLLSSSKTIIATVTERKDVLFVRDHEIAIIKNGLKLSEYELFWINQTANQGVA